MRKTNVLLAVFITLLSFNIILLSYKWKKDFQARANAEQQRLELIELNKQQLEILKKLQ